MPRINNLPTDGDLRDNDFLIGYDGDNSNVAKKFKLSDLKEYTDDTTLDGYRDGRFLVSLGEKFQESAMSIPAREFPLISGTGEEEADSIIATGALTLSVGASVASIVFAHNIEENDLIVIERESTGDRDFGVVAAADEDGRIITFKGDVVVKKDGTVLTANEMNENHDDYVALADRYTKKYQLGDWTKFNSASGYDTIVTLYKFSAAELFGNLVLHGDVLDENGETILNVADVVSLSGDNVFTGQVTFEEDEVSVEAGLKIGEGNDTYTFPPTTDAINNNEILAYNNGNMEFTTVPDLLQFGASENQIAEWAEGDNTDTIPRDKLAVATSSTAGTIIPGTNLSVGSDGTLNASGTVGTIAVQEDGTETSGAASTLNFTGTAVASTSANGQTTTITINSGATAFGSGEGNVAAWAEGDDTTEIPQSKLTAIEDNTQTFTVGQVFNSGITIGSGDEAFSITEGTAEVVANQGLISSTEGTFTPGTIVLPGLSNTFTADNSFERATGAQLTLKRDDETPASNDIIGRFTYEGYSTEASAYEDLIVQTGRYINNENYELGQFRIDAGYVTKSDDTYGVVNSAFTVDRDAMTVNVASVLNGNVTLGDASSDTLTVNATATFEQSITGAVTEVVNDRDSSQTFKIWHGTEAQLPETRDANTIYFVEEEEE